MLSHSLQYPSPKEDGEYAWHFHVSTIQVLVGYGLEEGYGLDDGYKVGTVLITILGLRLGLGGGDEVGLGFFKPPPQTQHASFATIPKFSNELP